MLSSALFFAPVAVGGIAYALVRRSTRELALDETGMSIRSALGTTSLQWADVVGVERAFDDGIRVALATEEQSAGAMRTSGSRRSLGRCRARDIDIRS